jgi:hypothetical protein
MYVLEAKQTFIKAERIFDCVRTTTKTGHANYQLANLLYFGSESLLRFGTICG